MSKYLMIDDSGDVTKSDVYGADELESVIDGSLTVVDITDPDKPTVLDDDGDFVDVEEWGD